MDLQTARLHIWHTAWLLDQGNRCNYESSRAKSSARKPEWRVVDRCVQILGGRGVTGESVVMRIFSDMRAFRIYDGPSEVHRWSMAKEDRQRRRPTEGRRPHRCGGVPPASAIRERAHASP
jgi:acyl-CoA dehydrogenase